ncbi:uncharacterized protein EV420DRAFT_1634500 [Desarmillaria tabescens]|uniref:Uncharacterized protein n=1 Tax=Armillaria tabescens TaxID=1929756 RepID=A0AA39TYI9_ARMTA|nr:uncharacterized protein EV420DRAFT_1634500 [Desarmillaria tabescens]KAK0470068.1 hypothetical protein EV420DRAFT_1634500 [Desarmillaria tabescens]
MAFFAIIIGVAIGMMIVPMIAPLGLSVLGFGAAGPIAGGIAASIQSLIGNVVAGSWFAIVQSIAMGGAIPAGVYAVFGALGGGIAAIIERVLGMSKRRFLFVPQLMKTLL